LLHRLERRAGLADEDRLVLLDHGRIAAGPPELKGALLPAVLGHAAVRKVGDRRYRILATNELLAPAHAPLAVLSPQQSIDAANNAGTRRLGLALLAILALIALAAYILSRSIVRTLGQFVRGAKAIA